MTEEPEETPKDDAAQHSARQSVRLSSGGRQGVRERSSSESRPGAFASKSKGAIDEPVHGGSETLSRIAVKSAERVGKKANLLQGHQRSQEIVVRGDVAIA